MMPSRWLKQVLQGRPNKANAAIYLNEVSMVIMRFEIIDRSNHTLWGIQDKYLLPTISTTEIVSSVLSFNPPTTAR